jgi:hypothetical protein
VAPRTLATALAASVAVVCAICGVALAAHYPIAPVGVVSAFLLWMAVAYRWPFAWLAAIPALLPISGFATWTGWFTFEELDLLVLGAAASGYARYVFRPEGERARKSPGQAAPSPMIFGWALIFTLSCCIALYRGIIEAGSARFDWIGGYESVMNSVRLFKSFAEALLLWPLLRARLGSDRSRALDSLAIGLTLGLGGASLAALWERAAFTDVLNFSSDYRTTALFWEMHVGGAALDGFLALTVPFAVWEIRRSSGALRTAAMAALLALAGYACLTTFSRGVYLSISISLGVLWLLSLRQKPDFAAGRALASAAKGAAVSIAAAIVFYLVFRSGGYRALAAFVATVAVAMHVATSQGGQRLRIVDLVPAIVFGFVVAALGELFARFIPKGPYVIFFVALVGNVGYHLLALDRPTADGTRLRWTLLVWLAVSAATVALHWGGAAALRDSVVALVLLLAIAAVDRPSAVTWLPASSRTRLAWIAVAGLLAAGVAVFAGGAYMGDRFSSSSEDLDTRIRHWRNGLEMLQGADDWWLGKGLGTFPGNYFFGVPGAAFPGSLSVREAGSDRYLSLAGPRYSTSWGDLFRIAQRVPTVPGTYTVLLDIRAASDAAMHVELCEQHLLYNGACGSASVTVRGGSQWQHTSVPLDARQLSRGSWYAPRLAFFAMAVESSGKSVDIRAASLIDPQGHNVLANGDFTQGMARWIPVSERFHLPWHIKNLALGVLYDQGIVGLAAFAMLVLVALWGITVGRARDHPLAPSLSAAIVGFVVVGAFDSLLDVPRVAFLFYLLLLTCLSIAGPIVGAAVGARE